MILILTMTSLFSSFFCQAQNTHAQTIRLGLCEKDQSLAKECRKVKNVETKAIIIVLWPTPFNCYLGSNCQLKRGTEQENEIRGVRGGVQ